MRSNYAARTQSNVTQKTASTPRSDSVATVWDSEIVRKAFLLNGLILGILIVNNWAPAAAYLGSLLILVYLTLTSLQKPKYALFLIFGVKLTYDTLYMVGRYYAFTWRTAKNGLILSGQTKSDCRRIVDLFSGSGLYENTRCNAFASPKELSIENWSRQIKLAVCLHNGLF